MSLLQCTVVQELMLATERVSFQLYMTRYDRRIIVVLQVWDGLRWPMTGERLAHPRPPSAASNPASTARPRHPSAPLPSPPSAAQTRPILDMCLPTKHICIVTAKFTSRMLLYLLLLFFWMLKKNKYKNCFCNPFIFMFPYRFALYIFCIKFSNCLYMYYLITAYYVRIWGWLTLKTLFCVRYFMNYFSLRSKIYTNTDVKDISVASYSLKLMNSMSNLLQTLDGRSKLI